MLIGNMCSAGNLHYCNSSQEMPIGAARNAVLTVRFINIAHVLTHYVLLILPTAILGTEAVFGLPYGELLQLSLLGFIAFGLGSLPAGWIGDRWSRWKMMSIFFVGVGLSACAVGVAQSPLQLSLSIGALGLFASIYHPVGTAMLVAHTTTVARSIGVNGVYGNLGVAFAALATAGLTQALGWRAAFIIPGVVTLSIGALFITQVRDSGFAAPLQENKALTWRRQTLFWGLGALMLATLTGGLVFNAITLALPKLFQERVPFLHDQLLWVGALVCAVYCVGAVSQLLVGRLLEQHRLRNVFLPLAICQPISLAAMALAPSTVSVIVAAVCTVLVIFGQVTINDTMVANYSTDDWRARLYAVRYLLSFGASVGAVPLVAQMHLQEDRFASLFLVLAALAVSVVIAALITPGSRHQAGT